MRDALGQWPDSRRLAAPHPAFAWVCGAHKCDSDCPPKTRSYYDHGRIFVVPVGRHLRISFPTEMPSLPCHISAGEAACSGYGRVCQKLAKMDQMRHGVV